MARHLRVEQTEEAVVSPTHVGYRRDGAPNVMVWNAVAWWYVAVGKDSRMFARGGRVRTAREARECIRQANREHAREMDLARGQRKLRHKFGPNGELVPL